jgi:hypothetical protein
MIRTAIKIILIVGITSGCSACDLNTFEKVIKADVPFLPDAPPPCSAEHPCPQQSGDGGTFIPGGRAVGPAFR